MSDALPAFGPQARSAAIAAGACVLLGAGVYLYPRSASSAAPRDEPRKQKSRAKAAARRENAQSASDDDYDSGSASSSPKRAALPLSAGPPALNPVAIFWDVDVSAAKLRSDYFTGSRAFIAELCSADRLLRPRHRAVDSQGGAERRACLRSRSRRRRRAFGCLGPNRQLQGVPRDERCVGGAQSGTGEPAQRTAGLWCQLDRQ
jgi:hypothetical protein